MQTLSLRSMIDPDEALRLVLDAADPLPARRMRLQEAVGLWLAEDVVSSEDHPPFDRAMMDGYAVCLSDAGRTVVVVGEVTAGKEPDTPVQPGRCVEIMTGAACPPGTEAVIPKEQVQRQGNDVALPPEIQPNANMVFRGTECREGAVVLRSGDRLTSLAAGVLAATGCIQPLVIPRPRLAIITTGAELQSSKPKTSFAHIRDSNGPMLTAAGRLLRLDRLTHRQADDQMSALLEALNQEAEADILVITGGVSAGKYDLVPQALEEYGAQTVFHKVTQKPGKPMLFAHKNSQLVFGLPGNPLAVHLCFHRYVVAAIRRMTGEAAQPRPLEGCLDEAVRGDAKRTLFLPGIATRDERAPNRWRLQPLFGFSSADLFTPSQANGYIRIPPGSAGFQQEQIVDFHLIEAPQWMI